MGLVCDREFSTSSGFAPLSWMVSTASYFIYTPPCDQEFVVYHLVGLLLPKKIYPKQCSMSPRFRLQQAISMLLVALFTTIRLR
jgi:hypothetical protein